MDKLTMSTREQFDRLLPRRLQLERRERSCSVITADERQILIDDLEDTARELNALANPDAVYAEWLRRLGGEKNIRPYVDTLMAGRRRK